MGKQQMSQTVQMMVRECANLYGWANLTEIGGQLRESGIKYKKLRKFMDNFSDILEFRVDKSINPPVVYTRIKENKTEVLLAKSVK